MSLSVSRRRTRELLLKALYARTQLRATYDRDIFLSSYKSEGDDFIDTAYLLPMEELILGYSAELLSIVARLAPKFELSTMPILHILIIMISLTEILYFKTEEIPVSVSINEAIELAKKYSDDHGKVFVNGTLATFLKTRDVPIAGSLVVGFNIFT